MRYARLIMTHHGNPEPARFSISPQRPATAPCNRRPSATPNTVRFAGQIAAMPFGMHALAIN